MCGSGPEEQQRTWTFWNRNWVGLDCFFYRIRSKIFDFKSITGVQVKMYWSFRKNQHFWGGNSEWIRRPVIFGFTWAINPAPFLLLLSLLLRPAMSIGLAVIYLKNKSNFTLSSFRDLPVKTFRVICPCLLKSYRYTITGTNTLTSVLVPDNQRLSRKLRGLTDLILIELLSYLVQSERSLTESNSSPILIWIGELS